MQNLKISGGTISPEFNSRITSYTVNADKNAKRITITATAEDSTATVKGNGEIEIGEDEHIAQIQVEAENGSVNTYTLKIIKGNAEENTNKTIGIQAISVDAVDEKNNFKKINLTPDFSSEIYEYKCEVLGNVKSVSIDSVANSEDMTIEVLGNENLKIGENVVTIIVKNQKTEETITYQIIVNKTEEMPKEEGFFKSLVEKYGASFAGLFTNTNAFIISIIVIVVVLALLGFIIFKLTRKKGRRYVDSKEDSNIEDDEEENEEEKETVLSKEEE